MFEDNKIDGNEEMMQNTAGQQAQQAQPQAQQVQQQAQQVQPQTQQAQQVQRQVQQTQQQTQQQAQQVQQAQQTQQQAQQVQRQVQQTQQAQQTQQQYYQQQNTYNAQASQPGDSGSGGGGNDSGGNNGSRSNGNGADRGGRIRRHPVITAIVSAVVCGAIIAAFVVGSFAIGRNMNSQTANSVTITTNEDKLATAEENDKVTVDAEALAANGEYTVAQIAEECGSSVVAITNRSVQEVQTMFGYMEEESEGSGSGVIIGLTDDELLIVTNYHVVEDADELTVCFFDSEDAVYSALVKGTDPNNDLAVVAVQAGNMDPAVLSAISIATIGDSTAMKVGDEVVAIGNALGLGQSVTSGIISALDREVVMDTYTARLIQTDAAINPGNSGGALFNMQGELIGINSAKYASEEIEGMGFAIPTSIAQPVIESLMSLQTREKLTENYGCLNITGTDVTTDAYISYGMPQGVYIVSVLDGGAAANAGMQTGDIITSMDGISVTSIETMKDRLQYYAAGETVDFTIARNSGNGYEEMDVTVTLDNASEQDSSSFDTDNNEYGYNYGDEYNGYGNDYYDYGNGYGDGSYGYGDQFYGFGNQSYGYDYDNGGDYYYGYGY